jgi:hypothetical protein
MKEQIKKIYLFLKEVEGNVNAGSVIIQTIFTGLDQFIGFLGRLHTIQLFSKGWIFQKSE